MPLLNDGNTKTKKGEAFGWITYGMHLAPSTLSGKNVCPSASAGCAAACLNTAGRGVMRNVQEARINKTKRFFSDRNGFLSELRKEISRALKKAEKKGMEPCFRLNLTSDLPWESLAVINAFPNYQFYDYTKIKSRMLRYLAGELPQNYHLTFSRSEDTPDEFVHTICNTHRGNVAVVFNGHLPEKWQGLRVIDGDISDLRFRDPRGVIVGLRSKGRGKTDNTGFVVTP
tara:strand:+ start:100 stop:786 length:687 start_codon:yes stop_codon:yes gene_type:complete